MGGWNKAGTIFLLIRLVMCGYHDECIVDHETMKVPSDEDTIVEHEQDIMPEGSRLTITSADFFLSLW